MGLLRVVRDELPIGGERHAVDLRLGSSPVEPDVLMNMGQPRSKPAHGPLQLAIPIDVTGLMRKVVRPGIPILKLHVPQRTFGANQQFHGADVQARTLWSAEAVSSNSVAALPSSSTTSVWLKSAPFASESPIRLCNGSSICTLRGT